MRIIKTLALLAVLAALAICTPAQQNYLTQTTLSAAIPGQYLGPGSTGNVPAPTIITVASVTGIQAANPNLAITANQPNFQSALYIDREEMLVIGISGLALTVTRGVNGTVATPHVNGAMVLVGQPRWFYVQDPGAVGSPTSSGGPSGVPCILNNVVVTPWVNIRTGAQWYCNPGTLIWTPGFNNPLLATGDYFGSEAAAAATPILGPVTKVTGATGITSFTFSKTLGAVGLAPSTSATANSLSGQFCLIGGTWATTIGNNIGTAVTSTAGVISCWTWSGQDHVWYAIP